MDMNKNHRENADEGSNECSEPSNQDKPQQTQHSSKRSESSRKSQSRPTSKAASIGQHSRTRSHPQISEFWTSTNPYINFMTDFRKTQTGQKSAVIFQLCGEKWRNMTKDEKQPFIDAANKNKKLKQPRSSRKQQQKQTSIGKQQSKTGSDKDTLANKSSSSRKVSSPKKRKKSQQRHETQLKKKRTTSDTETDTDTDTSGSIHTATTDCASEDSDQSS